jgi:hypothetical protein
VVRIHCPDQFISITYTYTLSRSEKVVGSNQQLPYAGTPHFTYVFRRFFNAYSLHKADPPSNCDS